MITQRLLLLSPIDYSIDLMTVAAAGGLLTKVNTGHMQLILLQRRSHSE